MRKGPYRCPSGRRSGPRLRHLRGRHTGAEAGPDGTEPALAGPGWLVAAEEYSTRAQVLRDNHRVCRRAGGRRRDAQAACAALITAGVEHESARRMAGFVRRATLTHDWNERQCRAGGADVFPERRPPRTPPPVPSTGSWGSPSAPPSPRTTARCAGDAGTRSPWCRAMDVHARLRAGGVSRVRTRPGRAGGGAVRGEDCRAPRC